MPSKMQIKEKIHTFLKFNKTLVVVIVSYILVNTVLISSVNNTSVLAYHDCNMFRKKLLDWRNLEQEIGFKEIITCDVNR